MRQVYLVDDDPAVLKALSRLLRSAGYDALTFSSAEDFINHVNPNAPGCLVLDVSMPGITGLQLQQWLQQSNSPLPVVFLTGHGNIPDTVQAMKKGAVDFLTKPVNQDDLFRALQEASQRHHELSAARAQVDSIRARLDTLTPREREVLGHVVAGRLNKQIAADLRIAEKTIKVHRARVMQKMKVQSLAELVRLTERLGLAQLAPAPAPPRSIQANPPS